jgi:hypothetical protein
MFLCSAVMLQLGLNLSAVSLATYQYIPPSAECSTACPSALWRVQKRRTTALGRLTCCFWNKNCRFKLLRSIVSRSSTSMIPVELDPKPVMTEEQTRR